MDDGEMAPGEWLCLKDGRNLSQILNEELDFEME